MEFSLLTPDERFEFENYFQPIIEEFDSLGRKVEIKKKDKKVFDRVDSAFLKDNTNVYNVAFQTEKTVKVKIEVDTQPPLLFQTVQKALTLPYTFMVRCFQLPDLYAGKMHALVFRNWKSRVKGRDWYDFEWYARWQVPLDFKHLQERIREFNGEEMSIEDFKTALKERLAIMNIEDVKTDVRPFLRLMCDLFLRTTLMNSTSGRTITFCNWRIESCLRNNASVLNFLIKVSIFAIQQHRGR